MGGGGWVAIVVVVCGKIEKMSDWNKNWCGSRYGPCDYDSGDKKAKKKDKKATNTNRQKKDKKVIKKDKKTGGPKGPHALHWS